MELIREVSAEGFRSIKKAGIPSFGDFTALAGLNNSGKSNVLRALNAFFNDQTDPGVSLDLSNDYHKPDLRQRKRKSIRVEVLFELPDRFRFHKALQGAEQLLGSRRFAIAKTWTRGEPAPTYSLEEKDLTQDQQLDVRRFLSLLRFRYIPNRVLPTEIIRAEHVRLRDALVKRLAVATPKAPDAFGALEEASGRLIARLTSAFRNICPDDGEPRLVIPISWQEMIFPFGYKLAVDGCETEDRAQGAGIQSLLMLLTLYLVDCDYRQQFGWRQATVWAIEEPESSLHASLTTQVAHLISHLSQEPGNRLQVICTTHSERIMQYATSSVLVQRQGTATSCEAIPDVRDAVSRASRLGVSEHVHPLLWHPGEPLVLVEGKYDRDYLRRALTHMARNAAIRVECLEDLGRPSEGGLERLKQYISANADMVRLRPKSAPVLVVLDWDASSKLDEFQRLVSGAACAYKALAWPDAALNPSLGRSFKGVERSFSTRIVEKGIRDRGLPIGKTKNGTFIVQKDDYGQVKRALNAIVVEDLRADDLEHSRTFLEDLFVAARGEQ